MCAPIFEGVEPVKLESELSEIEAVTPTMPHSSNGAACHRTMPPKPLNVRFNLADVVVALRWGDVPAKFPVIEPDCAVCPRVCIGPSLFGAAKAVGVEANVE